MAFRDPYADQSRRAQAQGQYNDDFNPYSQQPYGHRTGPSYDNYGGYTDDPRYDYHNNNPGASTLNDGVETPGSYAPQEKTARALRNYRYDHHGGLWTKGSRGGCLFRFCCCTLMIAALLFVSILLALVLWIRPPNIIVGGVETVQDNGSTIKLVENGISVNLGVNISVDNPNYFAVNFKKIEAQIFYPINNTEIGKGTAQDVVFHAHSLTNWTFPFAINYTTTLDPDRQILLDLARKCGGTGAKSNLSVSYKITLALRILLITVSPTVKNTLNFPCPIKSSDLEGLIKSTGLNIDGLLGSGS